MNHFDLASLRAQLENYQNNHALLLPENFAERSGAIELNTLIEQIAQARRNQIEWGELRRAAQTLHQQCAAIDQQLFAQLRRAIRGRQLAPVALRKLLNRFTAYQAGQQDFIHWRAEALDRLLAGIWTITAPPPSQPLAAEMVHLEHTPASVVLEMVDRSGITPTSLFYDLGCGLGQVTMLVHLLTGAPTIGVELEPHFCDVARQSAADLVLDAVEFVNCDVRSANLHNGDSFFMFTPFRGTILQMVLEQLRKVAADHPITLCTYGSCTQIVAQQSWLHSIDDNADHEFKLAIFCS